MTAVLRRVDPAGAAGATAAWQLPLAQPVPHGGPGPAGRLPHDFSTNANAAGPLPSVLRAVRQAEHRFYPDPGYHVLREQLGAWHGVPADRVVVAASASAFIRDFTRAAQAWRGVRSVQAPRPGYGDYAAAALGCGLALASPQLPVDGRSLAWFTEPASPAGTAGGPALASALRQALRSDALAVLDLAYQPLRLDGAGLPAEAALAWQLWSPNKAAGLTGVRGAYAIAPPGQDAVAAALRAAAPSWPVGADGVALLAAFATADAQAELAASKAQLLAWRDALVDRLRAAGWRLGAQDGDAPSVTPFVVARPPRPWDARRAAAHGVQLRDAASLGLPGAWRISAQPPASLAALSALLDDGDAA